MIRLDCSLGKQGGRRRGSFGFGGPMSWLRVLGTSATVLPTLLRRMTNWRVGSRSEDET